LSVPPARLFFSVLHSSLFGGTDKRSLSVVAASFSSLCSWTNIRLRRITVCPCHRPTAGNPETQEQSRKHEKGQGFLYNHSPFVFSSSAKLTAGKFRAFVIGIVLFFVCRVPRPSAKKHVDKVSFAGIFNKLLIDEALLKRLLALFRGALCLVPG